MKNKPMVRRPLAHIAQSFFNTPLMIHPFKAEVIAQALAHRLGVGAVGRIDGATLEANDLLAGPSDAYRARREGRLCHQEDGVAVIPIEGTLLHRYGEIDPWSGATGYDGLTRKLREARSDGDVRAIWFDIDSPGGEVAGLNSFVREIIAGSADEVGGKPVWAFVNEFACSAAYAIASVCDRVIGPPDCIVGSIGACIVHVEISRALEEGGVTATVIRSSDRKHRGGQLEPMDDETLAKFQASVEEAEATFALYVAAGRKLALDDVLATRADWFTGPDALRLGLVDELMDEEPAWRSLLDTLGAR